MKKVLEKIINILVSFILEDEYINDIKRLIDVVGVYKVFSFIIIQYCVKIIPIKNDNIEIKVKPKLRP